MIALGLKRRCLKRFSSLILFLEIALLASSASAQDEVKWSAKLLPDSLRPGATGRVLLSAKIDDTWHIYAPTTPAGGPFATQITLKSGAILVQAGKISQPKPIRKKDEGFGIDVEQFERNVTFGIPVKIKTKAKSGTIKIQVLFQACNDRVCLPPKTVDVPVVVKIAD